MRCELKCTTQVVSVLLLLCKSRRRCDFFLRPATVSFPHCWCVCFSRKFSLMTKKIPRILEKRHTLADSSPLTQPISAVEKETRPMTTCPNVTIFGCTFRRLPIPPAKHPVLYWGLRTHISKPGIFATFLLPPPPQLGVSLLSCSSASRVVN